MSKIEWTNETWNPIIGCSKISEGCRDCYAEKMAYRLACIDKTGEDYSRVVLMGRYLKGWNGITHFAESQLIKPLKRKKPTMYFVCSMGDLFHKSVPFRWIDKVVGVIKKCPQHQFQILTKRADIMHDYFMNFRPGLSLSNLWLGVTAENQEQANKCIPVLLQIPAKVHFVSVEPMLSAIDFKEVAAIKFQNWVKTGETQYELDWVICGGETGPNARPMYPNWVRSLRDQCQAANVPFFFKQWGEYSPNPKYDRYNCSSCSNDKGKSMYKVGKKQSGCLLDGKEYKQFPNANS